MTHFLTEDFLLDTQAARRLYHDYAVGQPIYDYHCHLPPEQIANDYQFANLYDIWLKGDHYKWRLMRANGMTEHVCTGDAADYEKYCAWAETVPYTIGNPLYHWTHLELLRYFGINNTLLTPQSAKVIWDQCNEQLKQPDFSARRLINRMNVKMIGTTDDPIDSLIHHKKLSQDSTFTVKVLPSWRPDKAFNIRADIYPDYIRRLSEAANKEINSFQSLCDALHQRMDYFAAHGCKVADHAIDVMGYQIVDEHQLDGILQRRLDDKAITCDEEIQFRTAVLLFLSQEYRTRNWVQQYHMSALRNNDSMLFKQRGPDIGFDSMNDRQIAEPLSRLLDGQKRLGGIPKTILYSLNPSDNAVLASMAGNFQGDGIPGKVQFGSAWWFNDQKQGMTEQMTQLAQMGLLSRFIGMTTDSRSFLSYTRHEYFRRILCQLMGSWVEKGEAPNDMALLGHMVQEICFGNAKRYFSIELTD